LALALDEHDKQRATESGEGYEDIDLVFTTIPVGDAEVVSRYGLLLTLS
jgi:hypothetical protein